jgi:type I pantothenate kinase
VLPSRFVDVKQCKSGGRLTADGCVRPGPGGVIGAPSPWLRFDRASWSRLRADTPLTLDAADLEVLTGLSVPLSFDEVEQVYLPLTRLLNLYFRAVGSLHRATSAFLGQQNGRVPYVIGLAGSVAVGKSTFARVLTTLLSRWPDHPKVALVTTDGFLYPNAELERRGLMQRKGFPESYDRAALLQFVVALKSGEPEVSSPVYSHRIYDIVPGERLVLHQPDIVLVEGLNVLQSGTGQAFVSDYFDLSIYLDAALPDLRRWYVERFRRLRDTAFRQPDSYFHRYAGLTDEQADARALEIWTTINERNLVDNILPTRERATVVLTKDVDHRVTEVRLRRL